MKDKIVAFLITTKGKVISLFTFIITLMLIYIASQYPPSVKSVYQEYLKTGDQEIISTRYDGEGMFGELEAERAIEVLQMVIDDINNDFVSSTGGTVDDYTNVVIEKVSFSYKAYSNYNDAVVVVKNNSEKDITYIKINLYFKDDNGNIIGSDWTNDDSIIKPGAKQEITKMISNDIKNFSAEIADIRFR